MAVHPGCKIIWGTYFEYQSALQIWSNLINPGPHTSFGPPSSVALWKGNGTPAISGFSRLVNYSNLPR